MNAVAALNALQEMSLARIIAGIHQINAGLIHRDRVGRHKHADIRKAGILSHSTAVTVNGHVLHHVHIHGVSLEELYHGGRGVRHGLKEGVVIRRPDFLRLTGAVDIRLAEGGCTADRELLERSAVPTHRVSLKVRQYEERVIIYYVLADIVFLYALAVGYIQHKVRPLGVQKIDLEIFAPAVLLHGCHVLLGRVARACVGGVALDNSAVHGLDHRLPEVRVQEVLVPFFSGVHLHGDSARQLFSRRAVQRNDLFRSNFP